MASGRPRSANSLSKAVKTRSSRDDSRGAAEQQEARGAVSDGQWIAVAAVAELELALEIGAPQIIGIGTRPRAALRWRAAAVCPGRLTSRSPVIVMRSGLVAKTRQRAGGEVVSAIARNAFGLANVHIETQEPSICYFLGVSAQRYTTSHLAGKVRWLTSGDS
jgi:hypothetical protein